MLPLVNISACKCLYYSTVCPIGVRRTKHGIILCDRSQVEKTKKHWNINAGDTLHLLSIVLSQKFMDVCMQAMSSVCLSEKAFTQGRCVNFHCRVRGEGLLLLDLCWTERRVNYANFPLHHRCKDITRKLVVATHLVTDQPLHRYTPPVISTP